LPPMAIAVPLLGSFLRERGVLSFAAHATHHHHAASGGRSEVEFRAGGSECDAEALRQCLDSLLQPAE
jgi:hypothetical protein